MDNLSQKNYYIGFHIPILTMVCTIVDNLQEDIFLDMHSYIEELTYKNNQKWSSIKETEVLNVPDLLGPNILTLFAYFPYSEPLIAAGPLKSEKPEVP